MLLHLARPIYPVVKEGQLVYELDIDGHPNVPEAYLDAAARDLMLGETPEGVTYIEATQEEADLAGFELASYAVGHEWGTAECQKLCDFLMPAWAAELADFGFVDIRIARADYGLSFSDGKLSLIMPGRKDLEEERQVADELWDAIRAHLPQHFLQSLGKS